MSSDGHLVDGSAAGRRGPVSVTPSWWRRRRTLATPYLLLLPAIAILVVFLLIPVVEAIRLSFTSWDALSSPEWIGLENFADLLRDERFGRALLHNLMIVAAMPLWILVPWAAAWGLYGGVPGWRFFRAAFFIPAVLSPVVIGVYYGIVLGPAGPLNETLRAVGLGGLAREWLNEPALAMPIVIGILIWSTFGIGVLIFLAGLANVDQEQIDAARVDGASNLQIQRHVVFWELLPVIEFWAVLTAIISFTGVFPLIYALTRGGPGDSTFTVDFYLQQEAFANGNFGYASAIGVALLVIMAIAAGLLVAVLRWRRR